MLKPIDIVVLTDLILRAKRQQAWTQAQLAQKLHLSQASIHRSLKQLKRSGLWRADQPQLSAFRNVIVHAVRAVYPAVLGAPARGVPTGHAGPGLASNLASEQPYVWPHESGDAYGPALLPLHHSIPAVALDDSEFHELMALIDVFRVGGARARSIAEHRLTEILDALP